MDLFETVGTAIAVTVQFVTRFLWVTWVILSAYARHGFRSS